MAVGIFHAHTYIAGRRISRRCANLQEKEKGSFISTSRIHTAPKSGILSQIRIIEGQRAICTFKEEHNRRYVPNADHVQGSSSH